MTMHTLSKLRGLSALIAHERERLEELQARATSPRSPRLDGMPRPGDGWPSDRTGNGAIAIVDQEKRLRQQIAEYEKLQSEITGWIDRIKNPRIKLACLLRFCDGCTWQQVADAIGGNETEYSVKKAVRRYVEGR